MDINELNKMAENFADEIKDEEDPKIVLSKALSSVENIEQCIESNKDQIPKDLYEKYKYTKDCVYAKTLATFIQLYTEMKNEIIDKFD